jgi:site-specific recombinase XerD
MAEFRKRIESARLDGVGGARNVKPETAEERARWWRTYIIEKCIDPSAELPTDIAESIGAEFEIIRGCVISEETYPDGSSLPIYENEAEAERFADVAFGRTLPIGQELDRFLKERDYPARTADKYRRAVRRLQEYLREERKVDDAGRLTSETAGRFVDTLYAAGLVTPTVNDHVSKLNTYWVWLGHRMGLSSNPWTGQTRTAKRDEATAKKRPYTDDEMLALLSGDANRTLHDLMRVGALSGMRIEEIARQTVATARDGLFRVRDGKTDASTRDIPVHSSLAALVARRSLGKADGDLLFHELKAPPSAMKERSNRASNAFTRYRRRVGVDEVLRVGQRQSNVDFHSFRRWAATKAEEAGFLGQTISLVLGHTEGRQGMTLGRYSQPEMLEEKRRLIEAIKLPEEVPQDSPEGPLMGDMRKRKRGTA